MTPRTLSVLILDDDPNARSFLRWYIETRYPHFRVAEGVEAKGYRGFDIYLVDNDFDGHREAVRLVSELRTSEPGALIVVFSGKLDGPTYKALINAGGDGALEKSNAKDLLTLARLIEGHAAGKAQGAQDVAGKRGSVASVLELLRQWNRRLDAASATAHPNSEVA